MKILLSIALIALLTACKSGGSDNTSTPPAEPEPDSTKRIVVIGDALCNTSTGLITPWPDRISGFGVYNKRRCIDGHFNNINDYYHFIEATVNGSLIMAIGHTEAKNILSGNQSLAGFKSNYATIMANGVYLDREIYCLLPPLTENPDLQPIIQQVRDYITDVCEGPIIESAPLVGTEYDDEGHNLTAQLVTSALSH